jgi:hypothetical protein
MCAVNEGLLAFDRTIVGLNYKFLCCVQDKLTDRRITQMFEEAHQMQTSATLQRHDGGSSESDDADALSAGRFK